MNSAYLAGLIDGEGTIGLEKNYKSSDPEVFFRPYLTVPSTTLEIVEWLRDQYSGCVVRKKTYRDHHLPSFVWKVDFGNCRTALTDARPFLLVPTKVHRANMIVDRYPLVVRRNGQYNDEQQDALRQFREEFYEPLRHGTKP